MAISIVGNGALASNGGSTATINPAYAQATVAGNLVLAFVTARTNPGPPTVTCNIAGWTQIASITSQGSGNIFAPIGFYAAIWIKNPCAASETNPTFTASASGWLNGQVIEVGGVGASGGADQQGTNQGYNAPGLAVTATAGGSNATASNGAFAVSSGFSGAVGATTCTHAGGFTNLADNTGNSGAINHQSSSWRLDTTTGPDSMTDTWTSLPNNSLILAVLVTVKPGYVTGDFFPLL